jgi:hypothetical protein
VVEVVPAHHAKDAAILGGQEHWVPYSRDADPVSQLGVAVQEFQVAAHLEQVVAVAIRELVQMPFLATNQRGGWWGT